jgi:hypothetical protein
VKPKKREDMVFLTSDVELRADRSAITDASLSRDTVGWSDISRAIAGARGRVVVLLDACHSGHVSQALVVHDNALADKLAADGRAGAFVFAAALGRQASLEPGTARGLVLESAARRKLLGEDLGNGHGFFTGALLASLRDPGSDHNQDGALQLSEIVDEVTLRVTRLTNGIQTPWVVRQESFGDFTIGTVAAN